MSAESTSIELGAFLGQLIIILVSAKLFGQIAQRFGVPFVLGELLGGSALGVYGLQLIDPNIHSIHLLSQIGLIILLFEIGLETDLTTLIKLGPKSLVVALVGIILPLIGGFLFATGVGLRPMAALLIGGAFTATSIGISVRALAELGENKSVEGQIVLGAALIDDVLGLLLVAVVTALVAQAAGGPVENTPITMVIALTLLFPFIAVIVGSVLAKPILFWVDKMTVRGAIVIISLMMAFTFAYVAELIGTSPIIGAFTAGLILAKTHRADEIETQLKPIADFFTPIFFVSIGAAMNIQLLNVFNPANYEILQLALIASVIAFVTKFVSGYACFGKGIRRAVIGISMAPRGEVVLIFAQLGLATQLISDDWFAILILVIFATAIASPALLKLVLGKQHYTPVKSYSELLIPGFESEERL